MKKSILMFFLTFLLAFGTTACNENSDSSDNSSTTSATKNTETAEELGTPEDNIGETSDDMTLIWMSHWDLNPNEGDERNAALALFEDTYGGKIEYITKPWESRMESVAIAVQSGDSPDIIPFDWLNFPGHLTQSLVQPVDTIIDFNDALWSGVKDAAENFSYKDNHYAPVFSFAEKVIYVYNRALFEEEGLQDPYDLYMAGNWNWDTFKEIMVQFCNNGENRYGIADDWTWNSFLASTGKQFSTRDGDNFICTLKDPAIDRAMEFIQELNRLGLCNTDWVAPEGAFTNGNLAFLAGGSWILDGSVTSAGADSDIFFVPVPKDPNSTDYNIATAFDFNWWVSGSNKNKAVKTWFECNRKVVTDPDEKKKADDITIAASNWTQEMIDFRNTILNGKELLHEYNYNDDITVLNDSLYDSVRTSEESWTQTRESVVIAFEDALINFNNSINK